jgi:CBS domain-containing protein
MFNLSVREVMDPDKAQKLAPSTSVSKAAQEMARLNVGAVMVVDGEHLVGVFTERDALFRVIARDMDPHTTRISEVMTPEPCTIDPTKSYGYALMLMQENGFRHVPVVEDGKPIGMVCSRNAMDPELEEFASEARRRQFLREEHR